MATIGAGHDAYLGYAWETSYGTAGSPINKVFGHGQTVTVAIRNNMEKIWALGDRNIKRAAAKRFEGTASVDTVLANGWWLRGVLGSPATASSGTVYTYLYKEADVIPSFTIENGVDLDANVVRTLKGCVISSATITAAVNDVVRARFECPYANEAVGTTTMTAVTEDNDPFTFAHGAITVGGSTIAEIQSFELTVNNNAELITGIGSRVATNKVAKNREYNLRATVAFKAQWEFLDRVLGGTTAPAVNPDPTAVVTLEFDNGETGASQRELIFNLGSIYFDEHTLPQSPDDYLKEDVIMFAQHCGSATYKAGSTAAI
ncbi:MAG: phage tail tube protein [Candidatus Nanoarchaeia archaeon]